MLSTIAEFKLVNVIILIGVGPMFAGFYKSYKAVKSIGKRDASDF